MARCVHGVPLSDPLRCPNCAAREPGGPRICGVQDDSRRGWISVCTLPAGHVRAHPVKHWFQWIKGHPDADPNGPGPEPSIELPRRDPTPAGPGAPTEPTQLGYRRPRADRITPPPRRANAPLGEPLGTPERRERVARGGGGQFTSERESDQGTDNYTSPTGKPLPTGVEGYSVGSPSRGEGTGMSSVAEVKGRIDGIIAEVSSGQQAAFHAAEVTRDQRLAALSVLDASEHPAGRNAVAALSIAIEKLQDAVAQHENAINLLNEFKAAV